MKLVGNGLLNRKFFQNADIKRILKISLENQELKKCVALMEEAIAILEERERKKVGEMRYRTKQHRTKNILINFVKCVIKNHTA